MEDSRGSGRIRFRDVLAQVIGLLVLEGRVSYRALALQFDLDDEHLDAIRVELVRVKRLAVDEGGESLAWAGRPLAAEADVPGSRATAVPLPLLPSLTVDSVRRRPAEPAASDGDVAAGAAPEPSPSPEATTASGTLPPAPGAADAERRQLTVMFCDLVGSTELAGRLDPEDLREVVRAYQEVAAGAIRRFDGSIAQYLGDGMLAYFGYPHAHEDDARRAVVAGLDLVDDLGTLNRRIEADRGIRLAVRIGIHTGPVVVGAVGGRDRQEQLALGEAPNVAARIQGLAEPNAILISGATARLLGGAYRLEERGDHALKGVASAVSIARVMGPVEQEDPDEENRPVRTRLVGRDEEAGLLARRWEQAKEGLGQVVLVSGEAGIGKSRLVEAARAQAARDGAIRATYQCSPYHTGSTFYPVITHLHRVLALHRDEAPEARLAKLERQLQADGLSLDEHVPLLAALLSIPLRPPYHPPSLTPQQQKQQTMDTLVAWLIETAERRPVLAVWEDLHWADPSTLELLGLLVDQSPTVPMLSILTYRPDFQPPWPMRSHMTPLTLNRLERPQVEAMVAELAGGRALPAEVVRHIVAKTDGVPLFVEELTKAMLESGLLREDGGRYTLTGPLMGVAIPATLQDSLMARLDRLPILREVAQFGAVLGREFAYEMVRVLAAMEEAVLQRGLAQLVGAELLYQRGRPPRARYVFKHALIQDAAYASLLRSTRQRVHQQVAELLEARFPETVATEPELVAHHFTEAGCHEQAVSYWREAGRRAAERSANAEAASHLTRGLEVLSNLPDTPERARQELLLHLALGGPLIVTRGYASAELRTSTDRARELVEQVGSVDQRFDVLYRQWSRPLVAGQHAVARSVAEEFLHHAEQEGDPGLVLTGYRTLGVTQFLQGEPEPARRNLDRAVALYDPESHRALALRFGQVPLSACRAMLAPVLWLLGLVDESARSSEEGLASARAGGHFNTVAYAIFFGALTPALFRRDFEALDRHARALATIAAKQGAALWIAGAAMAEGLVHVQRGESERGLASFSRAREDWRATGSRFNDPLFAAVLADLHLQGGRLGEGLTAIDEALALAHGSGELFWEAEMHRVRGELLLAAGGIGETGAPGAAGVSVTAEAEACLVRALEIARRQSARSLELRAATSLARLRQHRGDRGATADLLGPVYRWFTKGLATPDLTEARALLDQPV